MNKCSDCKRGKLYSRKTEDGYTETICYVCGYYASNSEGYKTYSSLNIELFREYFPQEAAWKASPEIDRRFSSPEELTLM